MWLLSSMITSPGIRKLVMMSSKLPLKVVGTKKTPRNRKWDFCMGLSNKKTFNVINEIKLAIRDAPDIRLILKPDTGNPEKPDTGYRISGRIIGSKFKSFEI
jgi:hypothetical protein